MNKIIWWDYKEQIPFDELSKAVDGTRLVQIYYIETGGDEYAILVSDQLCMHQAEVQKIHEEYEEANIW